LHKAQTFLVLSKVKLVRQTPFPDLLPDSAVRGSYLLFPPIYFSDFSYLSGKFSGQQDLFQDAKFIRTINIARQRGPQIKAKLFFSQRIFSNLDKEIN
jgi:hypothetical protein